MTPLEYMRRHGAFLVEKETWEGHRKKLLKADLDGATMDEATQTVMKGGKPIGVIAGDAPREGSDTSIGDPVENASRAARAGSVGEAVRPSIGGPVESASPAAR